MLNEKRLRHRTNSFTSVSVHKFQGNVCTNLECVYIFIHTQPLHYLKDTAGATGANLCTNSLEMWARINAPSGMILCHNFLEMWARIRQKKVQTSTRNTYKLDFVHPSPQPSPQPPPISLLPLNPLPSAPMPQLPPLRAPPSFPVAHLPAAIPLPHGSQAAKKDKKYV